jgi:Holliday junction resolvase RusA-like endonuclease
MVGDITFRIPYPNKKTVWTREYGMNRIYAGKHWSKRRQDAEYWHGLVRGVLQQQKIKKRQFEQPVKIGFKWNDRLDLDNHYYIAKMIVDGLCGYILVDDNRKHVKQITHGWTDKDAVIVRITPINNN